MSTPDRLGGIIHTYQKFDPVHFPSPTAPPPDMLSPAFEHLLLYGSTRRLTEEELKKIVEIQLKRLVRRLENQKITLELSDAAKALVAQHGYDPVYGARPLKRAIQQQIENPLAREILAGRYAAGDTIKVGATGGEITFAKA